jgi:hypothetical protein
MILLGFILASCANVKLRARMALTIETPFRVVDDGVATTARHSGTAPKEFPFVNSRQVPPSGHRSMFLIGRSIEGR